MSDDKELKFIRCPGCRSLVPAVATRCRMCGQDLVSHDTDDQTESNSRESLDSTPPREENPRARNRTSAWNPKESVPGGTLNGERSARAGSIYDFLKKDFDEIDGKDTVEDYPIEADPYSADDVLDADIIDDREPSVRAAPEEKPRVSYQHEIKPNPNYNQNVSRSEENKPVSKPKEPLSFQGKDMRRNAEASVSTARSTNPSLGGDMRGNAEAPVSTARSTNPSLGGDMRTEAPAHANKNVHPERRNDNDGWKPVRNNAGENRQPVHSGARNDEHFTRRNDNEGGRHVRHNPNDGGQPARHSDNEGGNFNRNRKDNKPQQQNNNKFAAPVQKQAQRTVDVEELETNKPKEEHNKAEDKMTNEQTNKNYNPPHVKSSNQQLIGWLISFKKDKNGSAVEIREGRFFVSSSKVRETDLVISDASLPVPHCLMKADKDSGIQVQDLMSENGTYIKKEHLREYEAVTSPTVVEHGDWLKFGDYEVMVCVVPVQGRHVKG